MNISSEQEMMEFGRDFAKKITKPAIIELVGDVGAGKTTFVRGLAEGLGIKEPITSPSFTISKSYALSGGGRLIHYDFYRLPEPGIMVDDLVENLNNNDNIIVIEWGESITFVFVGNKLVIDMGGVHDAKTGVFQIGENGDIYSSVDGVDLAYSGVSIDAQNGAIVRIFHADRDSSESVFNVKFSGMNLSVVDTKVAKDGSDEITVAYDPTNPSYVAPLGESVVFKPSGTKGLIIMATVEGAVLIVFSIFTVIMVKFFLKAKK